MLLTEMDVLGRVEDTFGPEGASQWLITACAALGNQPPADLLGSPEGEGMILGLLDGPDKGFVDL